MPPRKLRPRKCRMAIRPDLMACRRSADCRSSAGRRLRKCGRRFVGACRRAQKSPRAAREQFVDRLRQLLESLPEGGGARSLRRPRRPVERPDQRRAQDLRRAFGANCRKGRRRGGQGARRERHIEFAGVGGCPNLAGQEESPFEHGEACLAAGGPLEDRQQCGARDRKVSAPVSIGLMIAYHGLGVDLQSMKWFGDYRIFRQDSG